MRENAIITSVVNERIYFSDKGENADLNNEKKKLPTGPTRPGSASGSPPGPTLTLILVTKTRSSYLHPFPGSFYFIYHPFFLHTLSVIALQVKEGTSSLQ